MGREGRRGTRALLALLSLCACEPAATSEPVRVDQLHVRAPDLSDDCHDLGGARAGARVCWGGACPKGESCLVERPLPPFEAESPMGWRCVGAGLERSCIARSKGVGAFFCSGERCVQHQPRVPDAHEWSCADALGAQLCLREARASGLLETQTLPGFVCGERSIQGQRTGQALCIDFSPDFPDGHAEHWDCRYEGAPSLGRICTRKRTRGLGAACDGERRCPSGAVCARGHCVPGPPKLSCWLDSDCASRRCLLGTCRDLPPVH